MSARRNPDGDAPLWRRAVMEAKSVVKRRLARAGTPVDAPDSPYLIVPILGQSNAVGMGLGHDPGGLDRPDPRVHQWAMCGPSKNTVILAEEPLLHEIPSPGVGFGLSFGKNLAAETGRAVLLIPGARGDTSFTPKNGWTWDPADTRTRRNLYRNAVAAIDAALTRYPGSTLAAILWHQGETDVPLMAASVYERKLDSVIDDVRRRYGAQLPFLVGQMVAEEMELSGKNYAPINAVHADTPNRRPRTAFVPGAREAINGDADRHYNAAGQRAMGQAMWRAYRTIALDDLANYGVK